jgi:hypothetical protein
MAISTTKMVAIAKPANSCMPDRNIPAIATMTVSPEISTDRPDVAAAIRSAAAWSRPGPLPCASAHPRITRPCVLNADAGS